MQRIFLVLFLTFMVFIPRANALFLIEDNMYKRSGRNVVSYAQIAAGNAVNISWGVWENSNLYAVFATGAGLGWKQRLITESHYLPFSWDLSLENTSLRNWHTSAYGTSLWKKANRHLSLFVKYEYVENDPLWPGLSRVNNDYIFSYGFMLRFWQNSKLILQVSDGPNPFGTFGMNILL